MDGSLNHDEELEAQPKRRGEGYGAPRSEGDFEIDLDTIFRILWRRKWVVVATTLLALVCTFLVVQRVTPSYSAVAKVMLDPKGENIIDIDSVVSSVSGSTVEMENQLEILRSTTLIERVIEKHNLMEDPEFNAYLREPSIWRDGLRPSVILSMFETSTAGEPGDESAAQGVSPAEQEVIERRATIGAVSGRMSARQRGLSHVIEITFSAETPEKAALVANAIADQYIVDQLEAKFAATQRATSWLDERADELRDRLQQAEAAIEEYKQEQAIVEGQSVELTNQQLIQLNTQLIDARSDLAQAEARYNEVSAQLKAGRDIASSSEVLNSSLIQRLREQEAELLRREGELASRYGERHPAMLDMRAELKDLRAAISREVRKVVDGLRSEVQVARARERTLQKAVTDLERKAQSQSQANVELNELEREARITRELYESFLARSKETSEQETIQQPDTRILSAAQPPRGASFPKKGLMMALAGVGGCFLGFGLIFLLESLNNAFTTDRQFEAETGLRVLASVPKLVRGWKQSELLEGLWSKPNSALAESIRSIRTSLLLANVDEPPKVICVTSSIPSEGKSTFSLLLAATTARMGKHTIIVDCDLRRPALQEYYPGSSPNGNLLGVVSGRASLEEAVIADPREPFLHVLPATQSGANPADILSSRRFANLLKALRDNYDFVVIDAPPALAVADPQILGRLADASLFVCRWNSTPRHAVQKALRTLDDFGVPIAGAALTMVDLKRVEQFGYGDARGYHVGDAYYEERSINI